MGMLPSPPPINFLINSLTLLGRDWSVPLKNLSFLSGVSIESSFISLRPSLAHSSLAQEKAFVLHATISIAAKSSMDSEEEEIVYQLMNRYIPIVGGMSKRMEDLGQETIIHYGGIWSFICLGRGSLMKFLSFNCRGVVNPSKKSTLKRMVESTQPDVILL
jgi:hypothetical protein